jgi:hypothetical protein
MRARIDPAYPPVLKAIDKLRPRPAMRRILDAVLDQRYDRRSTKRIQGDPYFYVR